MKKEEIKIIKYTTEDGKEFFDLDEAKKHEDNLMFEKLKQKSTKIGKYTIYRIDNISELKLLLYKECGIRHVRFDINELTYPVYICKSTDSKLYYFVFQLLDDVIDDIEQILDKLKNLK